MLLFDIQSKHKYISSLFLIVLVAITSAKLISMVIDISVSNTQVIQKIQEKQSASFTGSMANLFKKSSLAQSNKGFDNNLKLKTIFKSKSGSFVFFSDSSGGFFLSIGESRAGYKLEKILADRVVMSKDGKELEFKLEYAYFAQKQSESNAKITLLSRDMLIKYIQNPAQMSDDIRLDDRGGRVIVVSIKNGTFFDIAGIKEKDVIISINDKVVNSAIDLAGSIRTMSEKNSLSISIERDKIIKDMRYEIK